MKKPPRDEEPMIECPLCGQVLTYGDARGTALHPAMGYEEGSASLKASGALECRCGRTAVSIQQRGNVSIVIPRPGMTLGSSPGPDSSVLL